MLVLVVGVLVVDVLPEPEEPDDEATVTGASGSVAAVVGSPETAEPPTPETTVEGPVELTAAWVVDALSTAVDAEVVDVDVEEDVDVGVVEVAEASSAVLPESLEPPPHPLTRIPVAMASAETPRPLRKLNAIETT